jgi:chemotaxis protein MotB
MQQHGLRADQVAQVRGFADQQPRNAKDASDPANRRITVIVQYTEKPPPDVAVPAPAQSTPQATPPPEKKP